MIIIKNDWQELKGFVSMAIAWQGKSLLIVFTYDNITVAEIRNGLMCTARRRANSAEQGMVVSVPHNTEQVCDTHNHIILELCIIYNSNLRSLQDGFCDPLHKCEVQMWITAYQRLVSGFPLKSTVSVILNGTVSFWRETFFLQ